MTTVSLRFDDEMKKQLDEMCDEMGMNLTTFFMIYEKKLYGNVESHLTQLPLWILFIKKANQQVKNGQIIVKTMEELEAMERE